MPLEPHQMLAHYRLVEKIGEGGMGIVWKAEDTKLGRSVAIKVLPDGVSEEPDRLARFEREARTLASLHHPNVASIFGFEESGEVRFLVMELVEGEDLSQRLQRGAVSPGEAMEIARQIAEGLEAAHDAGVVHRDLKPANVKIAPDGTVKVLDFGLAKAWRGDEAVSGSAALSQSPTLAQTATAAGLILGTAAYMSPEQARGKPLDKRSDIWSFGVVLFELLTGERLFIGETVSDVLASVLKTDLDFRMLPRETPVPVRRLLRRCLERDPKQRLRDIGDARIEIDAAVAGEEPEPSAALEGSPIARGLRELSPWLIAGAALLALVATVLWSSRFGGAPGPASYKLSLPPPAGGQWVIQSNAGWGTLSPDGRRMVVRATTPEGTGLWVQDLGQDGGKLLPRTEGGFYPFWSPDGRWIAFFNRGLLQRVEIDGGLPERICVAEWGRGGSWSETGKILLTPVGGGAVHVVSAEGGETRPVTRLDFDAGEDAHYWPVWLPDGEHFLYFIRSGQRENQGIYVGRVRDDGPDEERRRVVASSSSGVFVPAGPDGGPMLLWVQDEALLARAFDPRSGTVSGPTSRIAEGVRVLESQRGAMISASTSGTLTWASSTFGSRWMIWYDRQGRRLEDVAVPAGSLSQALNSPNGRWVSFVVVEGGQGDIWVLDTETVDSRALTSSAVYEEDVTWSPDSTEILLRGGGQGDSVFFRTRVDGSDSPREAFHQATNDEDIRSTGAWLPGDWLVVDVTEAEGAHDLFVTQLDDPKKAFELAGGKGDQYSSFVSPDGGTLVYLSDESGALEGYLVSMVMTDGRPALGRDRQRIPVDDLVAVQWDLAGKELFAFSGSGTFFSVPVDRSTGRARAGTAVPLFDLPGARRDFAVAEDGERFLFIVDPDAEHQALFVLLNWRARLDPAH